MSMLYEKLVRPLLFSLDAETAHCFTIGIGRAFSWLAPLIRRYFSREEPRNQLLLSEVGGVKFPRPIGLAAGLDKNGEIGGLLSSLGVGFVEIGSVCRYPTGGNARPRLFRLPDDQAIVVNYGNPSHGAESVARQLSRQVFSVPLGVNLAPTSHVSQQVLEKIAKEMEESARLLAPFADYFTLNLSCPNVRSSDPYAARAGEDVIEALPLWLNALSTVDSVHCVFLKIVPTTNRDAIDALMRLCDNYRFVAGFMFNLPRNREYQLRAPPSRLATMAGAIAGPHTRRMFDDCLATWYRHTRHSRYSLIGSGGVFSAEDAYRKIRLGASLVQVLTALVYRGPCLLATMNRRLGELLREDGFSNVQEAIGIDVPEP